MRPVWRVMGGTDKRRAQFMRMRKGGRADVGSPWVSGFLGKTVRATVLAFSLFSIATFFLSIVLGVLLYFSTQEGLAIAGRDLHGMPIMLLFLFQAYLPIRTKAGSLFTLLLASFTLCLLVAWMGPSESVQRVLRRRNLRSSDLFRNWLLSLPLFGSALLSAELALTLLQEALGVPTGGIAITNELEFLLDLSYAAVFEEVGFRLMPIGATTVVLMTFGRTSGRDSEGRAPRGLSPILLAFFYPDGAKKRVGMENVAEDGWLKGIHMTEFLVSLYSAAAFGMAHVISGAGWGPGKFTTSSILGFALALIYLRYGIEASILTHWYFNYYLYIYELAPEFYPGLNSFGTMLEALVLSFGTALFIGFSTFLALGALRARRGRAPSALPVAEEACSQGWSRRDGKSGIEC